MLPLNCQNNAGNVIGSSVSNGESIQSLQSIDSNGTNLAMSPLSTMSMSPIAVNPCSPMGMSPMAPRHPRYATPVVPSTVHTTHPHSGGLSPMNDVKTLCYGRGVCETGKSFTPCSSLSIDRYRSLSIVTLVPGKDTEQTSVYYSSHSSMHHQYYQQTHHQMMSSAHHYQHHQQGMPTGYEITLPPPQHSTWPTDYGNDRNDAAHPGQIDDVFSRVHAFAWLGLPRTFDVALRHATQSVCSFVSSRNVPCTFFLSADVRFRWNEAIQRSRDPTPRSLANEGATSSVKCSGRSIPSKENWFRRRTLLKRCLRWSFLSCFSSLHPLRARKTTVQTSAFHRCKSISRRCADRFLAPRSRSFRVVSLREFYANASWVCQDEALSLSSSWKRSACDASRSQVAAVTIHFPFSIDSRTIERVDVPSLGNIGLFRRDESNVCYSLESRACVCVDGTSTYVHTYVLCTCACKYVCMHVVCTYWSITVFNLWCKIYFSTVESSLRINRVRLDNSILVSHNWNETISRRTMYRFDENLLYNHVRDALDV